MYAFNTVGTHTSTYITVQSILSSLGKLIKEKGRLTLFSIISITGLSRAKSGVDAVT